jgi:quercetin dioxygenase-like cupin family protein
LEYVRPVDFSAFRPLEFHSQLIADPKTGLESCVLISSRVPTGTGTTQGLHVHPADQFYYVLEGKMNVQIGGEQYTAEAESLVCIPAGAPHWNWNSEPATELHFELITPTPRGGLAYAYAVDVPGLEPALSSNDFFVRRLDRSRFEPGRASAICLADASTGITSCEIDVVELPTGAGSQKTTTVDYDQVFYTISGELGVQLGDRQQTVAPHTFIIVPAGLRHALWNGGTTPKRYLAVRLPPSA